MNKLKTLITHPLFSGSAILVAGSLGSNVINYLYHLVLGRLLGPEQYGVLVSIYSVLYIISIVPVSSSVAIVKFISSAKSNDEQRGIYHAINNFIGKVAIVGTIVLLISSPFVASFLHINDVFSVACAAFVFYLSIIALVNQSASQGLFRFLGTVLPSIAMSLTKLLLGVLLIVIGFGVGGAMLAVVVGAGVACIVARPFTLNLRKAGKKGEFKLKTFFNYSAPVLVQAIAFTSLMSIDVILVKHFFSEYDAGIYAAISTLGKIIYFAAQPITGAMFPIVSKKRSLGEPYLRIFVIAFFITCLVSICALLFYALFPRLVITTLYGQAYVGADTELLWMGAFYAVYTIAYFLTNFFLSLGKTNIVIFPFIAAVLQVVLIWLFHSSLLVVIQICFGVMLALSIVFMGIITLNSKKVRLKYLAQPPTI